MKKILLLLLVVTLSPGLNRADEWGWPTEKDYFSNNGQFVGHVTPPKYLEKAEPSLEVFEIQNAQRVLLWQCKLKNEKAPLEAFLSDNGNNVVTINEHGRVGYGDYVVAFYSKAGLIKNYSLEEILHLPKDNTSTKLFRLIPHSTTSRWWDNSSIKFFDTFGDKLYFCVWLHLFDRWIAWDPTRGEEVNLNEKMIERWNNKARLWSVKQIQENESGDTPYEFLGKLKNPDDRSLVEKLLSDSNFSVISSRSQTNNLEQYYCSSSKRLLAERLLSRWDGRPAESRSSAWQQLYYLGKVEGFVILPQTVEPTKATLWIYLIPVSITEKQWYKQPPVHRLAVSFDGYGFKKYDLQHNTWFIKYDLQYTRKFPFGISTITPGQYRIKAVLDKTEPLSKPSDRIYLPQQGDYQNTESPVIIVKAGEIINDININCTTKVIDGTD